MGFTYRNLARYRSTDDPGNVWLTPPEILEPVRGVLGGFDLDPCTEASNPTRAKRFYSLPKDGLQLPWDAQSIWVNPPYGELKNLWIDRCIQAAQDGSKVVLLIPAATETRPFQHAASHAFSVCIIESRIRYRRPCGKDERATHGSALLGYNVNLSPLRHLGRVFTVVA